MTIIPFPFRAVQTSDGWSDRELGEIHGALESFFESGEASDAEVGATESGDPQFYLVGPPPNYDCLLCITRLGQTYVLEDGNGRIVLERNALTALAEQAANALRRGRAGLVARIALMCVAIRHAFEEKVEPVLIEGEELLVHVAPQLTALA